MKPPVTSLLLKKYCLVVSLFLISFSSKSQVKDATYFKKQHEPGVKHVLVNGKFWVWTQKIGDGKVNLLLLHGGPGQSHEYFEIFSKYLPIRGVTIYYYDQFGSYFSEDPTTEQLADTSIWKVSRYVEEIEEVRKGLKLDKFFIYGHSYGALLALAYTYKYQPHIKGIIFSDMNPFPKDFDQCVSLSARQTDSLLKKVERYNLLIKNKLAGLPYNQKMYQAGFDSVFNRNFVVRADTLPDELLRTKAHKNYAVAQKIGPSTFSMDYGTMIPKITVPVLLIRGQYDFIISAEQIERLSNLFSNARYYIVPNAGHICFIDNPHQYFPVLFKFIVQNNR
jgi:proline iminopeptidase